MTDREQLESLVRDMDALKASLKRNQGLMREMLMGKGLGLLSLAVGLATSGFALACHFLSAGRGGFQGIPFPLRAGLLAFIALATLAGVIVKFVFIDRRAKEIEAGIGTWEFIRLFYSDSMLHSTIAAVILMIAGSAAVSLAGHPWLSVPIFFGLASMPINAVADATGLREYSISGYSTLAGAIASYFLMDRAPFLGLALASAAVYLSFAACAAAAWKLRSRG